MAKVTVGAVDHLVFACPDLAGGIRHVERLLGMEVTPGGQHLGLGTRNCLVGLGLDAYLEIVGPDPEQPDPTEPRWFQIDELEEPRLVTWSAKGRDLQGIVSAAHAAGLDLGRVSAGGRRRPDGSELRWEVTDPRAERAGGVIPFFIDWADSPHPSSRLREGCSLVRLKVEHPDAPDVERRLSAVGVEVPIEVGPEPRLSATLETPMGVVELA